MQHQLMISFNCFSPNQRSLRRKTSLSPDHVSSTAQTLTSTRPFLNAISLTTFSLTSVGIFDVPFGQEIQSMPSFARADFKPGNFFSSSARSLVKNWTNFSPCESEVSNALPRVISYPEGAFSTTARSLMPSFSANGLFEYPALIKSSIKSELGDF